jgi:hypothetical protein
LEAAQLRRLGRAGVLALARRGELRYDRMKRTGPVFHMLSSLDELGRTGFTAIADSPDQADALYQQTQATLLDRAEAVRSSTASLPRASTVRRLYA